MLGLDRVRVKARVRVTELESYKVGVIELESETQMSKQVATDVDNRYNTGTQNEGMFGWFCRDGRVDR